MISITTYKNWAVNNQLSAVVLDRNDASTLADASTRIGLLARAFNTKGAQRVRAEVMKDFTLALSTRYGASIAQQAIAAAGLTEKSSLEGWMITDVIGRAKSLRNQMRTPVGEAQNLRLGNVDISRVEVLGYLNDKRNVVTKFLNQRAVAVQLLGEMPLTQEDWADFNDRAQSLLNRLFTLRNAEVPAGIPANDFRNGVTSLINALESKVANAQQVVAGKPLSNENVGEYKDLWRQAAIKTLTGMRDAETQRGNAAAATVIGSAINQLNNNQQIRTLFNDRLELSKKIEDDSIKPFIQDLLDAVKNKLARQPGNAAIRRARIDTGNLTKKLKVGFRQTLNERPWNAVSKTVMTSVGNRPVQLGSTITPAVNLGRSQQAPRGLIAGGNPPYPENVNGYMCHSAETNHAVNLSVSNLTVGEPGGEQRTAFTGVRHGVHSAWEVHGDVERAQANANRAKEAVIAAFLAKYGDPPQLPEAGDDGTTTINLQMTSVSLLTPDPVRHKTSRNSASDERSMLRDQSEAWNSVELTGVEFECQGRRIRIQPQIVKFNFGVNDGAVNYPWPISNLTGGWRVSGAMNNAAFPVFAGQVQAFINNPPPGKDREVAAARTLLQQCQRIFETKGERKDNNDAYKLAARIAVLSYLIGNVPCWNCKSGKDRTGEMDVECKFLATLIARGESIPEPGARLTKSQKELFRSIALEGGNFDVQKMNTGLAGFKTGGVSSIPERLSGQKYRDLHSGGSKFVNV